MDKSLNKKKIYIIIAISVLCVSLIGGTVAYYVRELFTLDNQETITYGLDYYINYTKGQNIENVTLNPGTSYEGAPGSDIEFWKKDDTYNIFGHIYLDINSMSNGLSNSGALKYVVLNNGNIISEGVVTNEESSMLLTANIPLSTNKQLYTVHIWLDKELANSSASNVTLSLSVRCEATMQEVDDGTATWYITNLYLNNKNKVVTNNNIKYQYAQSVNLMNDRLGGTTGDYDGGNIRYYGANPNNYVDIGDRDSDGNVIPYRIIGVFKDVETEEGFYKRLIKVIRADSIGEYSWDNKSVGIGSSTSNNGSNDWSDARLMMLLNPGYDEYNEENPLLDESGNIVYGYEGSLWWNSKSGTCYWGDYKNDEWEPAVINATKACDFTSSGLSSDVRDKIESVVWNLGTVGVDDFSNIYYKEERGTLVYTGRPTEWTGKVALLYPSDYGYAADFNVCKDDPEIYSNECYDGDWLSSLEHWLYLTPRYGDSDLVEGVMYEFLSSAFHTSNYKFVDDLSIGVYYLSLGIYPTFYLKSELSIVSGDGTKDNPYVIG